MTLIEIATETQDRLDQANSRIASIAEELATVKAALDEKTAYQAAMESRVAAALQSGDPEQYVAIATEFLTPAQEAARREKLAQVEQLRAQAAALEAELSA